MHQLGKTWSTESFVHVKFDLFNMQRKLGSVKVALPVCLWAPGRLSRQKEGVSKGMIWEPSRGTLNKLTKVVLFSDQAQRGEHLALLETL